MATNVQIVVTATSPAAASTVVHTERFSNLNRYDSVTAVDAAIEGGVGGTLDVYLQRKLASNSWADWVHFPQLASGGAKIHRTFDSSEVEAAPVTVGFGTDSAPAVAMAAGKLACGHPGSEVRIIFVAGASTSAGTAQTITLHCVRST